MEKERVPSEEERQYEFLWRGETIDQDYLFKLNPNYRHLIDRLVGEGIVKQMKVDMDGETINLLQLNEARTKRK